MLEVIRLALFCGAMHALHPKIHALKHTFNEADKEVNPVLGGYAYLICWVGWLGDFIGWEIVLWAVGRYLV